MVDINKNILTKVFYRVYLHLEAYYLHDLILQTAITQKNQPKVLQKISTHNQIDDIGVLHVRDYTERTSALLHTSHRSNKWHITQSNYVGSIKEFFAISVPIFEQFFRCQRAVFFGAISLDLKLIVT